MGDILFIPPHIHASCIHVYLTYKIPTLYLLRGFQGGSNRITVPLDGIPRGKW